MSTLQTFEDLQCWKACRKVRLFVKKDVLPNIPKEERFRLTDQIIRATRSATANIAEGYGRYHYLDNAKFCSNGRGSIWETLDHLIVAEEDGYIDQETLSTGRTLIQEAIKITNGYITYLQKAHHTKKD